MTGTTRATSLLLFALAACGARAGDDSLEIARQVLGPETLEAKPFALAGQDWIAAAGASAPRDRVTGAAAPGGIREVVLLRRVAGSWQVVRPGLYADPAAGRWGVEDADGDGAPEVWAAQIVPSPGGYRVDLRAYAPVPERLLRLVVPGRDGAAPDSAQREFSYNVMESPAMQRWLSARAAAVAPRRRG